MNVNAFSPVTSKKELTQTPSNKLSASANIKLNSYTMNSKKEDPKQIEINLTDDFNFSTNETGTITRVNNENNIMISTNEEVIDIVDFSNVINAIDEVNVVDVFHVIDVSKTNNGININDEMSKNVL